MATPTLALSFAAGSLAFLSPCIVPLVPSYMSFIGGVTVGELKDGKVERAAILLRTVLFVLGFSMVFVALGVLFSGSGLLFSGVGNALNIIAGIIVIVLGLNIIFDFWKVLNVERKVQLHGRPAGHVGAVLIGMAFGAGWTPCIGPILAGILFLAGTSGNVGTGIAYLAAFSIGLGMPFILAGFFFSRVASVLNRIKRYLPLIKTVSGVLLVGIGLLIAFGRLQQLTATLARAGARLAVWDTASPGLSNWLFAAGILVLALSPMAIAAIRLGIGKERARPFRWPKPAFAAAGIILAVLNVTDIVSIAGWFTGWFLFTGL
ncbi:MAG: cytochrome c biogenesis protein CcdA [Spirochaetia bacterium]